MMKTPLSLAAMLLCAFPLLLAGCASTASPPRQPAKIQPASLQNAENIGLGQRAYADGPIIEAVSILEDSRCPQNARCVWAGRLKLQMIWHRGNGAAQPFELTLGEITHIADGHIEITAATPPRVVGEKPPAPEDYRFSFQFRGGL